MLTAFIYRETRKKAFFGTIILTTSIEWLVFYLKNDFVLFSVAKIGGFQIFPIQIRVPLFWPDIYVWWESGHNRFSYLDARAGHGHTDVFFKKTHFLGFRGPKRIFPTKTRN